MAGIDTPFLILLFRRIADRLEENRGLLCELDGEIGDGDHGTSMANGFAAIARLSRQQGKADLPPGPFLREAAGAFLSDVGATVGPLYASGIIQASKLFGADADLPLTSIAAFFGAVADGIAARGKAGQGDKTMLDAWLPAVQAAQDAAETGAAPQIVACRAAKAAHQGAEATGTMIASRGRAARLKQRSLGQLDPGAVSAALIIEAIAEAVEAAGEASA